jgi:phage/plasmid-like protein (TIGR03299 family)
MSELNITRPWDKIGTRVEGTTSVLAALQAKNLDFDVEVRQGYFFPEEDSARPVAADGRYFIVRKDTNKALGMCRSRFTPMQNRDAFSIFQPILDQGIAQLDSIGCFGNGEKVWLLATLNRASLQVTGEDGIYQHLLLVTGHDGLTPIQVGLIPVRIWCTNMLAGMSKYMVKFKHTETAGELLDFMRLRLAAEINKVSGFVNQLKKLAKVEYANPEAYFRHVFGLDDAESESTNSANKVARLHELFLTGRGNQLDGVKGTVYAAYNAVTEYLNYEAGRNDESRIRALWFGANAQIAERALTLALEVAAAAGITVAYNFNDSI